MITTPNTTSPKAAEKDSVVTPFPGLEELSQQTYEIPFTELAPHLQRDIQARVKRLAADDMLAELKALKSWLGHHLEINIVTRSIGKGGHDGDGNSWAAAAIPTWDVRQRVDEIDAAIAKAEGQAK